MITLLLLLSLLMSMYCQIIHILLSWRNNLSPIWSFPKVSSVSESPFLSLTDLWYKMSCLRIVLWRYILKGLKSIGINTIFRSSLRKHMSILIHLRSIRLYIVFMLFSPILTSATSHSPFPMIFAQYRFTLGLINDRQLLLREALLNLDHSLSLTLHLFVRMIELSVWKVAIENDKIRLALWIPGLSQLRVDAIVVIVMLRRFIISIGMPKKSWLLRNIKIISTHQLFRFK